MVKVDASQTFDVDAVELNGSVAVKILVLSIDPYLRGRMRAPEKGSYNVRAYTHLFLLPVALTPNTRARSHSASRTSLPCSLARSLLC